MLLKDCADIYSFEHFENLADVQMLAMLSCVLSQPATIDGASKAIRHLSTRVCCSMRTLFIAVQLTF